MKCNQCGTEFEGKFCPSCGVSQAEEKEMQQKSNVQNPQPVQNFAPPIQVAEKAKKPVYKKWWFWVIIVVVALAIIGSFSGNGDTTDKDKESTSTSSAGENAKAEIAVIDFTGMDNAAIKGWADTSKVICTVTQDYSDTVEKDAIISQSVKAGDVIHQGDTVKIVLSLGKKPSAEYQSALKSAQSYSKTMHMSKQGVYDQLTSEYGGKFPADAAQYAIDNVQADWNANALESAKSYQKTMNMSKNAIYDQLISEYGGKFTKEEAQYAVDNLEA